MKKMLTFNNSVIVVSVIFLVYMIIAQFNDTLFETSKWILWILAGIALVTSARNKTMILVGIGIVVTAYLLTVDVSYLAYNDPVWGLNVYKINLLAVVFVLISSIASYVKGGLFSSLGHPMVMVAFVLGAILINNLEFFFVIQHGDSNVPIFIPQLWEYNIYFVKVLMVLMYMVSLYVINMSLYIRKRLKEFVRTTM